MRKILILFTDLFNIGGLQQYNRHLCNMFFAEFRDAQFTVLCLHDTAESSGIKKWENIKIETCGGMKAGLPRKIKYIVRAISACVKEKPDFLVCGHADLAPVALFLKKTFRLRYAVLTHGTDVWGLKNGIKYEGLKKADAVLAVSRYTKSVLISNGIDEGVIKLLPDTIDTSLFFPRQADAGLVKRLGLAGKRVLLTVGRLHPSEKYKGHDTMLKVMRKLGENYIWLIAGTGGDLDRLRQSAKELSVSEKVVFLGGVDQDALIDYYNLCDLFVMPSKKEGFGIVFLEALACGKPVIGGCKDGTLEPLLGGRAGFAVDPDSVEEIINAVESVFASGDRRVDPLYLRKEAEDNFGIKAFNRRAREIFSPYLS